MTELKKEKDKKETTEKTSPKEEVKEVTYLPTVKLTKSQVKLFSYWQTEIGAIQNQFMNALQMLSNEIKKNLVETFAEEQGVEMGLGHYKFNPRQMQFDDASIPGAPPQNQPKNLIPSGKGRPS